MGRLISIILGLAAVVSLIWRFLSNERRQRVITTIVSAWNSLPPSLRRRIETAVIFLWRRLLFPIFAFLTSVIGMLYRAIAFVFSWLRRWLWPTTHELLHAITYSLPEGEKIEWFGPNVGPASVRMSAAVTQRHLMTFRRGFFRRKYQFVAWDQFNDVRLTEGPFRTRVTMIRNNPQQTITIYRLKADEGRLLAAHARRMITVNNARRTALGRPCPFCNEFIKVTATHCPHCTREVPPLEGGPPPVTPPPIAQKPPAQPGN